MQPWTEVPLWAPDIPEVVGNRTASSAKALATGMRCRPVAETVTDTWRALNDGGYPRPKYLQGNVADQARVPDRTLSGHGRP